MARAADKLGYSAMPAVSGAGHDAQMLARVCPTAMIFVPSHQGISHNPAEHTDPADLQAGADTLLQVVLGLTLPGGGDGAGAGAGPAEPGEPR